MLEVILRHLNNWFISSVREGNYTVDGGSLSLPFLADGQYFRICGSTFNDGLHRYPVYDLVNESFDGVIWALAIPQSIINLSAEIEEWQEKNAEIIESPYQSESFGGYTYTKSGGEQAVSWQSVFAERLKFYRKPKEMGFMR